MRSDRPLKMKIEGFGEDSAVEDVSFENFSLNSAPLRADDIPPSGFARNIRVSEAGTAGETAKNQKQ